MEIHGEDFIVTGDMTLNGIITIQQCFSEFWPALVIEMQLDDPPSELMQALDRHWSSAVAHMQSEGIDVDKLLNLAGKQLESWKAVEPKPIEFFFYMDLDSCESWNTRGRTEENASSMVYCIVFEDYAAFTAEGDAVCVVKECIDRLKDMPNPG